MLRFDRVTKQFPGSPRPAVAECSLEIPDGTLAVLLGPSGCGKTTLLKMVNRLIEPTSGTIYLDTVATRTLDAVHLRRGIGYVIQQAGLFPHMTVAENIAVTPALLNWPRAQIAARVRTLLELVELPYDEYARRYPLQLSGGQQQRVGLARALAADPPILLMDEPFGALDALTRAVLQNALLVLQEKLHKTILFVTHDVEEALRLADRLIVLQAGTVVQYDTPGAVLARPASPFVRALTGADDVLRRLSLIPAGRAARPFSATTAALPSVALDARADLRDALAALLRTGTAALTITEAGRALGQLTLADLYAAAREDPEAHP